MTLRENLCWKINWYRQSELEGAMLLGRIVRAAGEDAALVGSLTRHCADEAEHAWLWTRTLLDLDMPVVKILRSYQSFYAAAPGGLPASIPEVLALTHIFERRVDARFRQELKDPRTPPAMQRTLRVLIAQEQGHLDWVGQWLERHPDGAELLQRYREIDARVYQELLAFEDRIADIPGLGEKAVVEKSTTSISQGDAHAKDHEVGGNSGAA